MRNANLITSNNMHSQNNEENIILKYFGNHIGTVLDLGANDGRTFSNSLACIERGWGGVLVEPAEIAFSKLDLLHSKRANVECLNVGVSNRSGMVEFHDSGTHLGQGDSSLLSTFKKDEMERWKGTKNTFVQTKARLVTFNELFKMCKIKTFDLITIDIEGEDYNVLSQMDLIKLQCNMLIVETNGKENEKFISYARSYGMVFREVNPENLIFVK